MRKILKKLIIYNESQVKKKKLCEHEFKTKGVFHYLSFYLFTIFPH